MDSKDVISKPYDCNAHDLIYGGVVDAHGIIISAITKRLFNFFRGIGLWRRRLTTESTEDTEKTATLCALCDLCIFPIPFQKIVKSLITKEESDRQIKTCEARIKEILT